VVRFLAKLRLVFSAADVFCILHSAFFIVLRPYLRHPNPKSASTSKKTPSHTAPVGDERPEQRPGL
jgi:hypothetical protein